MKRTLPDRESSLRGLTAARWLRESSQGQADRHGPPSQRRMQDRAIADLGLTDSGIERLILKSAWSGPTGDVDAPALSTPEAHDLIGAAEAGRYQVLLVGYTSRFMRDPKGALTLIQHLHQAGVVVYICDDRILSSDPRQYATLLNKLTGAWTYSADISQTTTAGWEDRFESKGLPGGNPPYGYDRTFAVIPEQAAVIRDAFETYATGTVSMKDLADRLGWSEDALKNRLRNQTYYGMIRRKNGDWRQGQHAAIISEDLWARAEAVRTAKTRGHGPHKPSTPYPLNGRLFCACGIRIRMDGHDRGGVRTLRHPGKCETWGKTERRRGHVYDLPTREQLRRMDLSDTTVRQVTAALAQPPALPDVLAAKRRERQRRALAEDFAANRINAADFLARSEALKDPDEPPRAAQTTVDPDQAVRYLRNLRETLNLIERVTPQEAETVWQDLIPAVYERVEHVGTDQIQVTLTPAAHAHGLALALPERVALHWRPRRDSNPRRPP